MSASESQKRAIKSYKKRLREKGLIRKYIWVNPQNWPKIKAAIKKIEEGGI